MRHSARFKKWDINETLDVLIPSGWHDFGTIETKARSHQRENPPDPK